MTFRNLISSAFITLAMCLAFPVYADVQYVNAGNVWAAYDDAIDDGTVKIANPPAPLYDHHYIGEITIPEYIGSRKVTGIRFDAFQNNTDITAVIIPGTVTTIDNSAFRGCSSLKSVRFNHGDDALHLGSLCFYDCMIEFIFLDRNLTSDGSVFQNREVNSVYTVNYLGALEIGTHVTILPDNFLRATRLEGVLSIPANVIKVGNDSFNNLNCDEIRFESSADFIDLGMNTSSTGNSAPFGTTILERLYVDRPTSEVGAGNVKESIYYGPSTILYSRQFGYLYTHPALTIATETIPESFGSIYWNKADSSFGNLTLLDGVTHIGSYAFQYHKNIECVVFPDNKVAFGNDVGNDGFSFEGCTALTEVKNLHCDELARYTFSNCNLSDIDLTNVGSLGTGCLNANNFETALIPSHIMEVGSKIYAENPIKNVIIEDSDQPLSIPDGAAGLYSASDVIEDVYIGRTIYNTDEGYGSAFSKNRAGKKLTFGPKCKGIGNQLFKDNGILRDLDFGTGVESIGKYAFQNCGMEEVVIPANVKQIGYGAFWNCWNLRKVTFILDSDQSSMAKSRSAAPAEIFGDNMFAYCALLEEIHIKGNRVLDVPASLVPDFSKITLHVPIGMKTNYESSPVWSKAKEIVEDDFLTGIDNVMDNHEVFSIIDGQLEFRDNNINVRIFSFDGKTVFDGNCCGRMTLPAGAYIVIVNGISYKVML